MLKIRRTVVRQKTPCDVHTRGPFLTESQERDGGWRQIVITLHPTHMILRHFRGDRLYPLTYEKAIAIARRDFLREKRALRGPKRSAA
jgi:hypothetical protein